MKRFFSSFPMFSKFRRDRRGNILILSALMSTVLVYSVGVAVDYMRAVHVRTIMQANADAAALAGAAAYFDSDQQTTAEGVAANYLSKSQMPSEIQSYSSLTSATYCATSDKVTPCGNVVAAGNQMTVSIQSNLPTTFMAVIEPTMQITVTAVALNPFVNAKVDFENWHSDAYDGNYIYWYVINDKTTIPYFDPSKMLNGSQLYDSFKVGNTTFNLGCTNITAKLPNDLIQGNLRPDGTTEDHNCDSSASLTSTARVGFLLFNQTGGRIGYGSNQYGGGSQGSTHSMYTQASDPQVTNSPGNDNGDYNTTQTNSDGTTSTHDNGGYSTGYGGQGSHTGVVCTISCSSPQNCSLQIDTTTSTEITNQTVPSSVQTNHCYGTTEPTYANESCSQLGSQALFYSFNDMGGGTDDFDYNDAQFAFYCGASGTNLQVRLTN
jgi:Flp pilus assembly protein TadG